MLPPPQPQPPLQQPPMMMGADAMMHGGVGIGGGFEQYSVRVFDLPPVFVYLVIVCLLLCIRSRTQPPPPYVFTSHSVYGFLFSLPSPTTIATATSPRRRDTISNAHTRNWTRWAHAAAAATRTIAVRIWGVFRFVNHALMRDYCLWLLILTVYTFACS
jgi:hypothetical protein